MPLPHFTPTNIGKLYADIRRDMRRYLEVTS
jgi:hypothetical protein